MKSFKKSPDPQFFRDLRDRVLDTIQKIRTKRRLQSIETKKKSMG